MIRDLSVPKNVYSGKSPMQNRTDSGIPHFSTPQPNFDIPLNYITVKVQIYTKYEIKVQRFFRFLVFFQLFVSTSEMKVIEYRNQNMAVLLNIIAIKVCKMHKNMG